ncbi:MAG: YfbU family protein [Candidatus Obscuribacter phosphatis]|uniref:YfbU family protein n=1 Tax=Candidatus Obscuribacter phosphatis TaxID=1906157 RepID=A0A8J7PI62_9BACT|nr:YfbU family protein [Candidatus Obscuribacter phosphatis]
MKNRVKQLRERKGISQIDLAERLGVSRQALSAVETEKQSPSLQTAMKVARELDTPLAQIFSLEDESMQSTKSPTLSKVERLNFANQFAILKALHKDNKHEAGYYEYLEEIFRRGYESLYHECFDKLWTALPTEVAELTLDILEMHRALLWSLGERPNPADIERVKFQGFDGNSESQYLSFAKFFTADGSRYSETKVVNSYMPTLDRYKKMLAEWERMQREQQLSKAQIESILDAAEA